MITKLTKKQEEKIPEYLEKYLQKGLCTKIYNKEKTIQATKEFYKACGYPEPTEFVFLDSPKATQIAANKKLNNTTFEYMHQHYGSNDSSWIAFYSFIQDELLGGIKCDIFDAYKKIADEVFWFIPLENSVFFSRKPTKLMYNEERKLHCEDSAAIEFADGYSLYALNGTVMTTEKWVITTPKEKIKPDDILQIKNVEQRMQAIKYIGLEKMIDKMGYKVLDKKGNYELLLLNILDNKKAEYLKMVNPTTGEIHVEGVKPGIKTVDEARMWRLGLDVFQSPRFEA